MTTTEDNINVYLKINWDGMDIDGDGIQEYSAGSVPGTDDSRYVTITVVDTSLPALSLTVNATDDSGNTVNSSSSFTIGENINLAITTTNTGNADCQDKVFTKSNKLNLDIANDALAQDTSTSTYNAKYTVTADDITAGSFTIDVYSFTKYTASSGEMEVSSKTYKLTCAAAYAKRGITVKDSLEYNGNQQTPISSSYDVSSWANITGTYKATNAGEYSFTITPKSGYT